MQAAALADIATAAAWRGCTKKLTADSEQLTAI